MCIMVDETKSFMTVLQFNQSVLCSSIDGKTRFVTLTALFCNIIKISFTEMYSEAYSPGSTEVQQDLADF